MRYDLPTRVEVDGADYEIRSDYRAALDICAALADPELSRADKVLAALMIFYPGFDGMPPAHYEGAARACFWFLNGGAEEEPGRKAPKLVDWEQDFPYIAAPVNRVLGQEIRAAKYLHWWSFLSAYYEIGGNCVFAQIVQVRDKLARGRPLDKAEREWYRRNRALVDFKHTYTEAENELLRQWTGK